MPRILACAALLAALVAPAVAEDTPGVTQLAPGVTEVDGSKVPSLGIDVAAVEAAIKDKKSYRTVRALLGSDGIESEGPAGSTVHIYKAHDTVSAKNLVLILFVKDGTILDHLVQWV